MTNRGATNIEWNGNLKQILEESGITVPEYSKADVIIYKNGDVFETKEYRLESSTTYTIPISTFIVFQISNITECEAPVETETSLFDFISSMSMTFIIMVYILRRKRTKI